MKNNLPSNQDIYEVFREFPWLNTTSFLNFTGIKQSTFSNKAALTETEKKKAVRYFTQSNIMKAPAKRAIERRLRDWLRTKHEAEYIHLTGIANHVGIEPSGLYRWVTGSRETMAEGYFEAVLAEMERFREGGTKIVRRPTQN